MKTLASAKTFFVDNKDIKTLRNGRIETCLAGNHEVKFLDATEALFLYADDKTVSVRNHSGKEVGEIHLPNSPVAVSFLGDKKIAVTTKNGYFCVYTLAHSLETPTTAVPISHREFCFEKPVFVASTEKGPLDIYFLFDGWSVSVIRGFDTERYNSCEELSIYPKKAAAMLEKRDIDNKVSPISIAVVERPTRMLVSLTENGIVDLFHEKNGKDLVLHWSLAADNELSLYPAACDDQVLFSRKNKILSLCPSDKKPSFTTLKTFGENIASFSLVAVSSSCCQITVLLRGNKVETFFHTSGEETRGKTELKPPYVPEKVELLAEPQIPSALDCPPQEITETTLTALEETATALSEKARKLNAAFKKLRVKQKTLRLLEETQQKEACALVDHCREMLEKQVGAEDEIHTVEEKQKRLSERYEKILEREFKAPRAIAKTQAHCQTGLSELKDYLLYRGKTV
ncbi:MAG: uncharacterized protein A8A55_0411 [Amphiamblys sp. WSBS2006]|nr:MAG: uncharacterized protein A8A55_0411 [Amphiamblys sp. WSBS2006]